MKKSILVLLLLITAFVADAQPALPSYRKVVAAFFKHYEQRNPSLLSFAKKKDGWYVLLIQEDNYKAPPAEFLFWSPASAYLTLPEPFQKREPADEDGAAAYLSDHGTDVYIFDRCRYYGYGNWDADVIRAFEGNSDNDDVTLESLARAYSNYSSKYLWNQYSGTDVVGHDSLMRPLEPLEVPGEARTAKAFEYLNKAIATYRILASRNPHYKTLIGDARLRVFNETMNAAVKMKLAGDDARAKLFLDRADLDAEQVKIAANLLNSCADSSILFTTGDNNTFQMWYVQEKMNIRPDVRVISQDLLGLPVYIDYVKNKMGIRFSTSPECYSDTLMLYTLYSGLYKNKQLGEWISDIQKQSAEKSPDAFYPVYKYNSTMPELKTGAGFAALYDRTNISSGITFALGRYTYINELIQLDIINTNINTFPVYFTNKKSMCENDLMLSGMVFRLLPLDTSKSELTETLQHEDLQQYLANVYQEVNLPDDRDYGYLEAAEKRIYFYWLTASYFDKKNKKASLNTTLDSMLSFARKDRQGLNNYMISGADLFLKNGRTAEGVSLLEMGVKRMMADYKRPPDPNFPVPKSVVLSNMIYAKDILKKYKISSKIVSALYHELTL